MCFIEKLSNFMANKISEQFCLDKDRKEIIAYGAYCLFQTIWGILAVIILGAICNVLWEGLLVSIFISVLRKYSGGVHSSSSNICALFGAFIASVLAIIIKNSYMYIGLKGVLTLAIIVFIYSFYILKKLAPVDSPSKPIVKEEKRKAFKEKSLKVLYVSYIMSAILLILSIQLDNNIIMKYVMCIYIGIVWQSFTLTATAHVFLNKVDKIITSII